MQDQGFLRRRGGAFIMGVVSGLFVAAGIGLGVAQAAQAAQPNPLAKLIEAAQKEGSVMWYESSPDDQFAKVQAAFEKRYPKIKLEQTRLRGGEVGTRIIAESQANAPTGDVGTTGLDILIALDQRGLLHKPNWAELGIPKNLIATPYAVTGMASTYCIIYNTKLVSEADAPKKWDDLLSPKWKGKIGLWNKSTALAFLQPAWGEEKTLQYTKKLAEQQPVMFQSTFNVNDAVASGEILVAITNYHTVIPSQRKGAPVKIVFAEVTPYEAICTSLPVKGSHPNAAKLFTAWLLSVEGAMAYESATFRGNPFIAGTETHKVLTGKKLATFAPDQSKYFADLVVKIEKSLMGR
ncbi:MAG: extracellular solute-binding protein [Deltaproteobacteria bacterium]|nr:extracellular solute-binding protein [Deltaproteobacteria bacterium]